MTELQIKILKSIPIYPKEISFQDISKKLGIESNRTHQMIYTLSSAIPLAEEDNRLCFLSLQDKKNAIYGNVKTKQRW